ncbi:MAG: hypothetical protein ING90_19120 [Rhodocyclaceae bacterium]|nr:hypothetical protein [Rhodocyclaceae bacterium]MCA3124762.1 hypothetical protein [Rhodocyclaceae bacterium]MCA3129204.1 hypothetical protein [Rhodocyclaceae bacterium]MCA3140376.1 hypothetical protein [Rhodocyclaceae bacterium]
MTATHRRATTSKERIRIMLSRKIAVLSLALAGFAASGLASAAWISDPETGAPGAISELNRDASTTTRKAVSADTAAALGKDWISADGLYRYVGGEEAWTFIGAEYEWRDGRFVRTDRQAKSSTK